MTIKQEELKKSEMGRKATRERIQGAIMRLDKEKTESDEAIRKIHLKLSLSYLWGVSREILIGLEKEKDEHLMFVTRIYPKIKEGFSELIRIGYIDDIPGPKKSKDSKELPS